MYRMDSLNLKKKLNCNLLFLRIVLRIYFETIHTLPHGILKVYLEEFPDFQELL